MPLSIALPSTKPAAEVPIGEGTIQGLEYTWFDYDMTDFAQKAQATFYDAPNRTLKFGENKIDFENTLMIPDVSIQGFKIPNPLHRPLKDGSSVTFKVTNAALVSQGQDVYVISSMPNNKPVIANAWYPTDVELTFISGKNLFILPSCSYVPGYHDSYVYSGLTEDRMAYLNVLRATLQSDADFIYAILHSCTNPNWPTTPEKLYEGNWVSQVGYVRIVGDSRLIPHFKLSGKLLY